MQEQARVQEAVLVGTMLHLVLAPGLGGLEQLEQPSLGVEVVSAAMNGRRTTSLEAVRARASSSLEAEDWVRIVVLEWPRADRVALLAAAADPLLPMLPLLLIKTVPRLLVSPVWLRQAPASWVLHLVSARKRTRTASRLKKSSP